MLLEITDWTSVVKQIASATSLSITDICYEVGLAGTAKPPAEPRHSEGEALLILFKNHVAAEIPRIKLDTSTRCPCCCKKIERIDLIRMGVGKFRCIKCVKKISSSTSKQKQAA